MPKYFSKFPKLFYKLDETSPETVTNLTAKFKFNDGLADNSVAFYEYDVSDGETPELIAAKMYDDPEKHWAILYVNNIINPQNDWLMDQKSLSLYIDKKYEANANISNNETGLSWAESNIHSYYIIETQTNQRTKNKITKKTQIDQSTYANTNASTTNYALTDGNLITIQIEKEILTYYDYESEQNENKRTIKILKREVVDLLDVELTKVFSS